VRGIGGRHENAGRWPSGCSTVVAVVWIDGAYDMVATQEMLKYGRASGIAFGPVDLVKYAEAFGATGLIGCPLLLVRRGSRAFQRGRDAPYPPHIVGDAAALGDVAAQRGCNVNAPWS
jgi:hypothetical protein